MRMNKKAIVLGGTNPHIDLIKNLKKRGFENILIDYANNPPAKQFADKHILESNLDQEKVLEIARDFQANLVINICLDQQMPVACYVSEKLGLPIPYSYETAQLVTNKELMKRKMVDSDIPTSKHIIVDENLEFDYLDLNYPVVIKPVDGTGALGVGKANNGQELKRLLPEALQVSKAKKTIVEEFNEGKEFNVYCFVKEGKTEILLIGQKFKMADLGKTGMQNVGSIFSPEIPSSLEKKIGLIANKIASCFNLKNSPILIQTIVHGEDVKVIEIAARIGGTGSYKTIKMFTKFDIIDATVSAFLGQNFELKRKPIDNFYATNILYMKPGIFSHLVGEKELLKERIIEEFIPLKTRGVEVGENMVSRSKLGFFIVKAANKQELFNKISRAIEKIEAYDISGEPILQKDLFLRE